MIRLIPLLLLAATGFAQPIINTIAGGSEYSGPAAPFSPGAPWGVAMDSTGNTYVSYYRRHVIYKIDTSGNVTRVVGSPAGVPGNSPSGTPAANALIATPMGLAVDGAGNLYFAEADGHRVRRVSTSGILTTVAGAGGGFGGDGGPATAALLDRPSAVAISPSGDIYVAEVGNARIRRISGGIITTVAGNGVQSFSAGGPALSTPVGCPYQMAFAPDGSLYIADDCGNSIRRLSGGTLTAVAGTGVSALGPDGPVAGSPLARPNGLAVDSAGNIFFTEDHRLRQLSGGVLTTIAGTGAGGWNGDGAAPASRLINAPRGLALTPSGSLLFTDYFNNRLRRLDPGVSVSTVLGNDNPWGSVSTGTGYTFLSFAEPAGVARDWNGNVYFVDRLAKMAFKRSPSGDVTLLAGGGATAAPVGADIPPGELGMTYPNDIAAAPDGSAVYIVDGQVNLIYKVTAAGVRRIAGNYTTGTAPDGASAATSPLNIPLGIAADLAGNVYVAEFGAHRVSRIDAATGQISRHAGSGVCSPFANGLPALSSPICNPQTLALDNVGRLLIGTAQFRILRLDSGNVMAFIGNGIGGSTADDAPALNPIGTVTGISVDNGGDIYFVEDAYHRIRRVTGATLRLYTAAGTGVNGFAGDGGSAFNAQFSFPRGVVAENQQSIVVTDMGNSRLRRMTPYTSSTALSVSPVTLVYNQSAIVTATVSPASALGFVAFSRNSTSLGDVTLSGGVASVSTGPLAVGVHNLVGLYFGGNLLPSSASVQVTVLQAPQTISFPPIPNVTLSTPPFSISATANSGLPVSLSVVSGPATISGNVVTVTGTGIVTIRASQPGNGNYLAASPVDQSFTVSAPPSDALAPVASNVTATPNPVTTAAPVALTALLSDAATGGSIIASAEFNLNGGAWTPMAAADGAFNAVSESVSATLPAFGAAGVHELCVRGRDAANNTSAPVCILFAVYDPAAGFVTGGGWITSPAGAWTANPALSGRANFGFVSRYQNGANVPTGNTQFQFQLAGLNFRSTSYEWLVVSGARAQFKGSGTINGAGDYAFLLTAIDGDVQGGNGQDRFRIKIWNKQTGGVLYDNQPGQSDAGDASTELGGGNIHIQK